MINPPSFKPWHENVIPLSEQDLSLLAQVNRRYRDFATPFLINIGKKEIENLKNLQSHFKEYIKIHFRKNVGVLDNSHREIRNRTDCRMALLELREKWSFFLYTSFKVNELEASLTYVRVTCSQKDPLLLNIPFLEDLLVGSRTLCNLFYRREPGRTCVVISGGALDTPNKRAQFLHAVNEILRIPNEKIGRWVIHQLFSFNTEKKLIEDMQANLKGEMNQLKILHFNTSFRPEDEDPELQLRHNLNSLDELYAFVMKDIADLLTELSKDEKMKKNHLLINELYALIIANLHMELDVEDVPEGDNWVQIVRKELKEISLFIFGITNKIELIYSTSKNAQLSKIHLLLLALDKIINLQIEEKKGSRCNEIEFHLFVYRILGMNTYICGARGLGRSAAVRAIADAQSQLEEEFYTKASEGKDLKDNGFAARVKGQIDLFWLLQKMERYRKILFQCTERLIKEEGKRFYLVSDLQTSKSDQAPADFRQELLTFLGKVDPKDLGRSNPPDENTANYTLRYLELVCRNLLSIEGEKTLFSTGVVGFRYDQDASKWTHTPNDLPLYRLPPFIRVDKGPFVKLLDFSEGGWGKSPSLKLTPAGRELLLRLRQLRKK